MAIVLYSRRGGVTGAEMSARIDTEELAAQEAKRLERLLDEVDFFSLPSEMMRPRNRAARQGGAIPDDIQHEITVERGARQHTVRVDDEQMPSALESLIEYLYEAAIQQARQKRRDDPDH